MTPACGFLLADNTRCPNPATLLARVIGGEVPCCATCAEGMPVVRPTEHQAPLDKEPPREPAPAPEPVP